MSFVYESEHPETDKARDLFWGIFQLHSFLHMKGVHLYRFQNDAVHSGGKVGIFFRIRMLKKIKSVIIYFQDTVQHIYIARRQFPSRIVLLLPPVIIFRPHRQEVVEDIVQKAYLSL